MKKRKGLMSYVNIQRNAQRLLSKTWKNRTYLLTDKKFDVCCFQSVGALPWSQQDVWKYQPVNGAHRCPLGFYMCVECIWSMNLNSLFDCFFMKLLQKASRFAEVDGQKLSKIIFDILCWVGNKNLIHRNLYENQRACTYCYFGL